MNSKIFDEFDAIFSWAYVFLPIIIIIMVMTIIIPIWHYIIAFELFSCAHQPAWAIPSFFQRDNRSEENCDERKCMEADVERISKQSHWKFHIFFSEPSNIQKYNVKD